jgi:hypothetical protein
VTSEYEDTAVDQIDFGSLSDEQLEDIAENDSRSTAKDKAQAEINRRNGGDDSGETTTSGEPITPLPLDPEERAEALGFNTEGMNFDPDFGQLKLQDYADAVEETGYHPPTGGPPDDSLTLEKAGERQEEEKAAKREAMEAQVEG